MSKYLAFTEVAFKDRALLLDALREIGCQEVRQGVNLPLGQYWREQEHLTADLIIPRHSIGNYYGDIGFARSAEGSYRVIVDELDRARALEGQFLTRLRTAYHERVIAQIAARVRGTLHRRTSGQLLHIKVRY